VLVCCYQEKCHQYWPEERSARYQYFVVDPLQVYNMPLYVLREFKVTDARVSHSPDHSYFIILSTFFRPKSCLPVSRTSLEHQRNFYVFMYFLTRLISLSMTITDEWSPIEPRILLCCIEVAQCV